MSSFENIRTSVGVAQTGIFYSEVHGFSSLEARNEVMYDILIFCLSRNLRSALLGRYIPDSFTNLRAQKCVQVYKETTTFWVR